jgi:tRNA (guanine-N7-)-methyltransferase
MHAARPHKPQPRLHYERAAFYYPAGGLPLKCRRLIVEVGPGRGDFLFHLAESQPDAEIVGIEIKGKRVDKLIKRIERRELKNVRLIQDDARQALPRNFRDHSIDEIHVHFPDPWPKKRHTKHRSMSYTFLRDCLRVLKVEGTITFITDHRPYAEAVLETFAKVPEFQSCYDDPMKSNAPDAFPTFFAQKWIAEGREITYQKYRRVQ